MNSSFARTNLTALLLAVVSTAIAKDPAVDFSNQIRPILADKCFQCHGPDSQTRQADLRLDAPSELQSDRGGYAVVVAGQPDQSALIDRIESVDEDHRMPPADTNLKLSTAEQQLLRQWIAEGAVWEGHWAFQPIRNHAVPQSPNDAWCRNPIDPFILRQINQNDMRPSEPADRETLLRRLSLDLTGLPPTPDDIAAFVADPNPNAYERRVERLLASARYGEHMSLTWLDAARYADTDGYQNDGPRSMWRWRDWVIDAMNRNLPFDQFTIEQLAGDWIPNATLDQKIATGFNRNHRYNSESGLVLEEFLLENAVDRVDTVSTVWMGLTMGCARCHDHKFDSFSQREYYQLVAFFDDVSESGRAVKFGNSEPWVVAPTDEQAIGWSQRKQVLESAKQRLADKSDLIDASISSFVEQQGTDVGNSDPIASRGLTHHYLNEAVPLDLDGSTTKQLEKGPVIRCNTRSSVTFWVKPRATDGVLMSVQAHKQGNGGRPGLLVSLVNGRLRFYIVTRWIAGVGAVETVTDLPTDRWTHVTLTNDGTQSAHGMKIFIDGQRVDTEILHNTNSNVSPNAAYPVQIGGSDSQTHFDGQLKDLRFYDRTLSDDDTKILATDLSASDILAIPVQQRSARQTAKLRHWFLEHHARGELKRLANNYVEAYNQLESYFDRLPTTMVMDHRANRITSIRRRGVYSDRGETVSPSTPAILPASQATNRLEFAKWLVNGQHPLTARVAVNRYWQHFFGQGLVETPEDFGVQGSPPSHPHLLDWLAHEFQRSGWDVKHIHREIVNSATYRQRSVPDRESLQRDPANRWLARAPRKRLPAHAIRDQALLVSGLLVSDVGGPSVKPYQPVDLWKSLSNMEYRQGTGADLYRRSLYTFWKRTLVPPTMSILDAADRENCVVRRQRTNTPLQALTLLNETGFVESARGLATRMLAADTDPIPYGFQSVTGRQPTPNELQILSDSLQQYRRAYAPDPQQARRLLGVGASSIDDDINLSELAAYTVLANLLLNLDEAITRD